MTIGEKLLRLRKARGWSQEALAERIGVSRQAVSRWEADSAKPDADKIVAICDLFGVSADYLLWDNYPGQMPYSEAPPVSELTRFIRKLTLRQWGYAASLVTGAVLYLLLCVLSTFKGYRVTTYVEKYDMELVWMVVCVCLAVGIWGLILHPFVKWIRDESR